MYESAAAATDNFNIVPHAVLKFISLEQRIKSWPNIYKIRSKDLGEKYGRSMR